jgi:hypothetical protein
MALAQLKEYEAIAEYNNSLARFEWAKGSIMQHDNVQIAEGQMPQCVQVRAVENERQRTAALILNERPLPMTHPGMLADGKDVPTTPPESAPPPVDFDVDSGAGSALIRGTEELRLKRPPEPGIGGNPSWLPQAPAGSKVERPATSPYVPSVPAGTNVENPGISPYMPSVPAGTSVENPGTSPYMPSVPAGTKVEHPGTSPYLPRIPTGTNVEHPGTSPYMPSVPVSIPGTAAPSAGALPPTAGPGLLPVPTPSATNPAVAPPPAILPPN